MHLIRGSHLHLHLQLLSLGLVGALLMGAVGRAEAKRKSDKTDADKSSSTDKSTSEEKPSWLAEEMPLQLSVRTPEDLAFKNTAEHEYLLFNLLAGGKLAWDSGDYATAATKWESLLRLPDLPASIADTVKPFAAEARKRAGGQPGTTVAIHVEPAATTTDKPEKDTGTKEHGREKPIEEKAHTPARRVETVVKGTVSGGGSLGPGGAVVWLERTDGSTPKPKPAKNKVVHQYNKAFVPRVLAVPLGTEVSFTNDDELYHDVFSLSKPNDFDLGVYQGNTAKLRTFTNPGPVQLLCNLHSQMLGWVFVVPSPYYGQADGTGSFSIHGVPPGQYEIHVWHEAASKPTVEKLSVGEEVTSVALQVGGDMRAPSTVPDKYGKPRQTQLGY
jgi:plastocyanin